MRSRPSRSVLPRSVITASAATVLVLAALGACAAPEDEGSAASEVRVVETDEGEIEIPADPQKVVLLNYALAGYLYDLDVPVAAMIPEDTEAEGVFSDYWADDAEAAGTEFMAWSPDGFDMQAILDLEPDLIIAGGVGFPLFQATEAFEDLNDIAPTVIVSGTKTTWQEQYEFLADEVFDQPEAFDEAVTVYEERVAEVRDAITVPEGESVFLSMTADLTPYVLIEDQGLPTVFSTLGFTPSPIFATGSYQPYTPGGDSFTLSTEQVGQVVDAESVFVLGFNGADVDVETLRANPVYAALPAFRADQAFDLPYYVYRGDFDETMELLDVVEETFATGS